MTPFQTDSRGPDYGVEEISYSTWVRCPCCKMEDVYVVVEGDNRSGTNVYTDDGFCECEVFLEGVRGGYAAYEEKLRELVEASR